MAGRSHIGDRVVFDVVMAFEMFEEAGKRREPAADGGGFALVHLAHDAFPGNHRQMVHFKQLVIGRAMCA
jgi:hypothetical protein